AGLDTRTEAHQEPEANGAPECIPADAVAQSRSIMRKTLGGGQYVETDPKVLAAAYIAAHARDNDGRLLVRHYQDQWYRFKDGKYVPYDGMMKDVWAAADAWTDRAAGAKER